MPVLADLWPDLWPVLRDWAEFAIRWLHVITAIAWIGSSFYFIALDLGLNRDIPGPADGEEWQVHGGGFYHIRKYMVAPAQMPAQLTWFKWESYATWLSGAALLAVLYWAGADLYLIDPGRADLLAWQAIAISAGSLAVGWLLYDWACRSALAARPATLMWVLFAGLVAASWGYAQVFTGRAALLHLGAVTATIMTANVFFVIIPNQKVVVADLRAGRRPDPAYGRVAKLRSTHNNYLTLPVVFLMLANHYPLAFGGANAWAIGALVFGMGVTIRHFFNTLHATGTRRWWTWAATAAIFAAIVGLSVAPPLARPGGSGAAAASPPPGPAARFAAAQGFGEASAIVQGACSMCHARRPGWPGLAAAPGGVLLETEADIAAQARAIFLQAGVTRAMPPPGARVWLPGEDRALLADWYRAGR